MRQTSRTGTPASDCLRALDAANRALKLDPGLGRDETALDRLERAYAARAGAIYGIKGSFLFVPLRGPSSFEPWLGRLKLT